ncbi:MAG: sulfatase-like hydrolase/transferase [Proteobacteria bacterium]|nr:sulfatase-like hydrolase/transferase [Pseudomonadota bacterium]
MLVALAIGTTACGQPPAQRVLLVTIDTLRADHVGSYGHPTSHTPTLDALAREGVRFDAAIAPTPLTLPSHASLLTGQNPPRHGVRNNSTFALGMDVPTLPERLRDAGFATAAFVGAVVLDRRYGLDRGFDRYGDRMTPRLAAGQYSFAERRADQVVDEAIAWLQQAPDRFFAWVHLYDPHANHDPPPGFRAAFPRDPYLGEIAFSDAQVGRLLAAVSERYPDEGTLVIVTSDHGESRGEHGELTHSLSIYDATQRVPLILRGAGLPTGRVVADTVSLVDVAPTVLALAGAAALADPDGRDLTRTLDSPDPRIAYVETLATQIDLGWSPLLGLRSNRWKYIRAPRPELYDLAADPNELENRAAELSDEVSRLDALLSERLSGAAAAAASLEPDTETRRQLEQLGYLVAGPTPSDRVLGEVGGIDPKDGMTEASRLLVGVSLFKSGEVERGLAVLETVTHGGFLADQYRAEASLQLARLDAALEYARAAARAAPGIPQPRLVLGRVLEASGRTDEAVDLYRALAREDASLADPLVALGRLSESDGATDEAERWYTAAVERRSHSAEALWRLAALRIERGAEAADLLRELSETTIRQVEPSLRLARAWSAAGHRDAARRTLRRALETAPEEPRLHQALTALADAPGDG